MLTQLQVTPFSPWRFETQSTRCQDWRLHGVTDQFAQPEVFAQTAAVSREIARFANPNSSWYSPWIRSGSAPAPESLPEPAAEETARRDSPSNATKAAANRGRIDTTGDFPPADPSGQPRY